MGTPISVKLRRINVYQNGIRQRHAQSGTGGASYFDPAAWEDGVSKSPEKLAKAVEKMHLYSDRYGAIAYRLNYLSPWPPANMPKAYTLQGLTDALQRVWRSQGVEDLEQTILDDTDDHENIFLPAGAPAGVITIASKPSWILLNVGTAIKSPRAPAENWVATETGALVRIDVVAPARLGYIKVDGNTVGTVNLPGKTYPLGGDVWCNGVSAKLTEICIQTLLWGVSERIEQVGDHTLEWRQPDHRLDQYAVGEYVRRTCGRILWQMQWLEDVMGLEKAKQESLGGKGGLLGKEKGHTQADRRNAPVWFHPKIQVPAKTDEPLWVFTLRTLKQVNQINEWIDGLAAMLGL